MDSKKINQLATNVAPSQSDLTVIGDPITGQLKKITWLQIAHLIGAQASVTLQQVTDSGNVTNDPITTAGLTLTNLGTGIPRLTSGEFVGTYGYGLANGVATLDSGGKIPASQLPSSVMEYKGTWDASTNTPTLADGTGDNGDVYLVNVAGSQNLGSGTISFAVGDWVVYNGTIWQKSTNSNAVASVFGRTGTVVAQEGDYTIDQLGDVTITSAATNDYLRYNGSGWVNTQFPTFVSSDKLVLQVRNNSGATINKGTVVYINGATAGYPTIAKAQANQDSTSAQTLGLVQDNISNNSNGVVVLVGQITGIDTSAYPAGTQLYLSGTTAGEYTSTKVLAPTHLVYVGIVTTQNAVNGVIEVKIQNGYELDEIHDVAISSVANNQVLVYESASTLWKNKSLSTILGGSPVTGSGTANQLAFWDSSSNITGSSFLTLDLTANYGYLKLTGGATYKNADIWLDRYSNAWENAIRFQTNGTTDWYVGSSATGSNNDFEIYNYGTSSNGFKIAKASNNVTFTGTITGVLSALATTATLYVVSDSGTLKTRTTGEMITDLAAVPQTRTLTINGTSYDLSANRTWSVGTVTSVAATAGTGISISGSPITSSGTLTITNTAPDQIVGLTAGTGISITGTYPSFTITNTSPSSGGTVTSIALATGTTGTDVSVSGSPITSSGTITLNIPTASATNTGKLSSTDWSTFNSKQGAITLTTTGSSGSATFVSNTLNIPNYTLSGLGGVPTSRTLTINGTTYDLSADRTWTITTGTVTGSGTTNYIPKWTSSSALGNSLIYDSGTNVGIGTASPSVRLQITQSTTYDGIRIVSSNATTQNTLQLYHDDNKAVIETTYLGSGAFKNLCLNTQGGNVGIGTAMPSYKLHVVGGNFNQAILDNAGEQYTALAFYNNGTTKTDFYYDNTNTAFNIRTRVAGPLIFSTNDSERMRITSAGDMYLTGRSTNGDYGMYFYSNDTDSRIYSSNSSAVSKSLMFYTSGSERMRITSGGNVGIGTTNPSGLGKALVVSNTSDYPEIIVERLSTGAGKYGMLVGNDGTFLIRNYTAGSNNLIINTTGAATFSSSVTTGDAFYLGASGNGGGTWTWGGSDAYIYSPTGKNLWLSSGVTGVNGLKIGTTGAATFSSSVTAGGLISTSGQAELLRLINNDAYISFYNSANSTRYAYIQAQSTALTLSADGASAFMALNTAGSERMRITSGGNVGIGTTSPSTNLTVEGSNSAFPLTYNSGYGNVHIQTNETTATQNYGGTLTFGGLGRTSGPTEKFIWAAIAGRKEVATSGDPRGYLQFGTCSDDTNQIKERMRITSGGYLKASNAGTYLNSTGTYHELRNNTAATATAVISATNASFTDNVLAVGSTRSTSTAFNHIAAYTSDFTNLVFKVAGNGDVTATAFFESSDMRLKSNIQDYKSNDILNISAKIYEKDGKIEVGYLAQDLENVLSSAISIRDNGYLDLSYRQVHTAKIAALEAKILELEAKLK